MFKAHCVAHLLIYCNMQELILSRAMALEATTGVLLDYSARRAYERSPQVEIAYNDMPGVLANNSLASAGLAACRVPAVPADTANVKPVA